MNSLPNNKFLDSSKLKELADSKINVTETVKFGFGHTGKKDFLLFPQCFQQAYFSGLLKVWHCVVNSYIDNKVTSLSHYL